MQNADSKGEAEADLPATTASRTRVSKLYVQVVPQVVPKYAQVRAPKYDASTAQVVSKPYPSRTQAVPKYGKGRTPSRTKYGPKYGPKSRINPL